MQRLPEAPLSAVQIVGRGIELGAACFGRLFMASSLIAFAALLPTLDTSLRLGDQVYTQDFVMHHLLSWRLALVWLVTLCLFILTQAFMLARLDRIARGGVTSFPVEWGESRRAVLPLVGMLLLCAAIGLAAGVMSLILGSVAGGVAVLLLGKAAFAWVLMVAFIFTVVFIAVYLLFTQFLVVLEHKSPVAAVNGSFSLVYGRWWHAFCVLFVSFVILIGIMLLAMLPLAPLLGGADAPLDGRHMLVQGTAEMVMTALTGPFTLSVLYLTYNDLRLRSQVPM